jgi:hypothetical protein
MVATTILSWISSDLYSSKLHHIIGANKAVKNAALIVFCLLGLPLSVSIRTRIAPFFLAFCVGSNLTLCSYVLQITYSVPFSVTAELTAGTGGGQGLCCRCIDFFLLCLCDSLLPFSFFPLLFHLPFFVCYPAHAGLPLAYPNLLGTTRICCCYVILLLTENSSTPSAGLATGVLNLAIVVPQVRYFVLNALFQYALLLDPDASILFADSCVTGSRSMGCSVWGRKRPGVCPGFCFLPDSRRACSSEATKAIKLVQVRRFSWLWVILGAQSRLLFRNLHEHTHSAPFCHLFTLK